jgi:uncharacterized protein YlxW (UPF0749 family)
MCSILFTAHHRTRVAFFFFFFFFLLFFFVSATEYQQLSDDEIKGYARKREQLEESILSLTAQKAELQSKVAELEVRPWTLARAIAMYYERARRLTACS